MLERLWSSEALDLTNPFYYAAGIGFLALAKAKHSLQGYRTPRPIPTCDFEQIGDYDLRVVDEWLGNLERYAGMGVEGKRVLELGPGADLGTGLYLLHKGAAAYTAFDAHDLRGLVAPAFYEYLGERLGSAVSPERLGYVCRSDFDLLEAFPQERFDLVFSQAAFEHFDNVELTLAQLGRRVRPGGVLIAEVDLQTHSRWIRDKDPNNIYRYSDRLYDLLRFRGAPNRVRPGEYASFLARYGWDQVRLIPSRQTDLVRQEHLADRFRDPCNDMDWISVTLCATRGG